MLGEWWLSAPSFLVAAAALSVGTYVTRHIPTSHVRDCVNELAHGEVLLMVDIPRWRLREAKTAWPSVRRSPWEAHGERLARADLPRLPLNPPSPHCALGSVTDPVRRVKISPTLVPTETGASQLGVSRATFSRAGFCGQFNQANRRVCASRLPRYKVTARIAASVTRCNSGKRVMA